MLIEVVLGIEGLTVPVPEQKTMFCITLDNGIDYIRTPYTVLADGAKVNQEFSLYVVFSTARSLINNETGSNIRTSNSP